MSLIPERLNGGQIYPNIPQGFAVIAIMILATLLFSPIIMISEESPWAEFLSFIYYLCSMGATLWFIRSIKIRLEGQATFHFEEVPIAAIPMLILAVVGLEISISPIVDLIPVPEAMEEYFAESIQQRDAFTFLLMVVAAPIFEELIFRGIILEGFLRQFDPWQAILGSSFLFGFAHLNPWQFVSGMALGAFIGWVYFRTRSLMACMIIHAAANLFGFAIRFYITPETATQSSADFFGGTFNYLVITGFAILITALCIWALDRIFENE